MNSAVSSDMTMGELVSRPKIHRLPLAAAPGVSVVDRQLVWRLVWTVACIMMLVTTFAGYQYRGRLLPVSQGALAASTSSENNSNKGRNSLYIRDKDGIIVGQIAKIPPQAEKISGIKADIIDKPAGRDLLAIISKY